MTGEINALEELDTLGVSLVKRGANRKKFVKKSEEIMDQNTIEILKTILEDVPAENEANAKAGEIVRKFGKIYPSDIYET